MPNYPKHAKVMTNDQKWYETVMIWC